MRTEMNQRFILFNSKLWVTELEIKKKNIITRPWIFRKVFGVFYCNFFHDLQSLISLRKRKDMSYPYVLKSSGPLPHDPPSFTIYFVRTQIHVLSLSLMLNHTVRRSP